MATLAQLMADFEALKAMRCSAVLRTRAEDREGSILR
jgi:hypothetical protein